MKYKTKKRITYILLLILVFSLYQFIACLFAPEERSVSDSINVSTQDKKSVLKGSEVLLISPFDTVSFNLTTNCANWASCRISPFTLSRCYLSREKFKFTQNRDNRLPSKNRVSTKDYNNSGYDRGHLSPAADNAYSEESMANCFLMTNIVPQHKILNRGACSLVEEMCRKACMGEYCDVYIVTGPVYTTNNPKKIGIKHTVMVPEEFFKVICVMKKDNPSSIAFLMKNDGQNEQLDDCKRTVNQIEEITGYDFFKWLPDDIEEVVEGRISDLPYWNDK